MSTGLAGVVAGAGYFSRIQLEAWKKIANVRIVAICDPDTGKAREAAGTFGIPRCYADADTMLARERADFLDIVTLPDTHEALTAAAAACGLHVLCQKPMAPDLASASRMVELCRQSDVRLMVNENFRWQPWFRAIKRLIDGGAIGTPYLLSHYVRRGDGRGSEPFARQPYFRAMRRFQLSETAVHQIDVSQFLMGPVTAVYCEHRTLNPVLAGEDMALVQLTHGGNAMSTIDLNRYADPPESGPVFGSAVVEGVDGMLRLSCAGTLEQRHWGEPWRPVTVDFDPQGYFGGSCHAAQAHFVACLVDGTAFETAGADYLAGTFRAVEAGYQSAATGRRVALTEI